MKLNTSFQGATYLFPKHIAAINKVLAAYKPEITKQGTMQFLSLTLEGDQITSDDVFEVGMLLQAVISNA